MRDEALFHCGISREIPPSLLRLESVLDTPDATQEVPRHTRFHATVLAQLQKNPEIHVSTGEET